MKKLNRLLMLPAVLLLTYCSSVQKVEPLYFEDGIANLSGMWVQAPNQTGELDIVLDVLFEDNTLDMRLLGEKVSYRQMLQKNGQILLTCKDANGRTVNMLAYLVSKNEMRLSATYEDVQDFMPVGQLGERVFRLKRVKHKKALVTSLDR